MITVEVRMDRLIGLLDEEEGGELYPQITDDHTITEVDVTPIYVIFTIAKKEEL